MTWFAGINYNNIEQADYIEHFVQKNDHHVLSRLPPAFAEIISKAPPNSFLNSLKCLESQRIHLTPKNHKSIEEILGYRIPDIERLYLANNYSPLLEIPSRWGVLITLRQIRIEEMLKKDDAITTKYKELGVSIRTIKNVSRKLK